MSRFKRQVPEHEQPQKLEKPQQILTGIELELHIDELNLNRELMDQPLRFRKYTKELSKLQRKAKAIKYKLEQAEAKLRLSVSKDGTGKRVAEIDAAITCDEGIMKIKEELLDAEEQVDDYMGIVKAFYQRHEMLKDLCANKRKELVD